MNAKEVRRIYLEYFQKHQHQVVASSSLIPAEDPTLLFTNAGMNQFKDCFLGKEKRSYSRATSSQKCVRAGGKHNDLEQVGFTARHLTFFEMLGNFSFGDYFKKEAITFAWDLLTNGYKLPAEKLYATVFYKDDEAYDLWHTMIGLPKERIGRLDEKDNFWAMGDTGPCGPCSEIYLDQGESNGCGSQTCAPGCECDRFIEIWNLVFMQYNRNEQGELIPLTQTGVDTGMGFERLCCVIEGKKNIFHSSVFASLKEKLNQFSGYTYENASLKLQAAYNVLCDHIRSSCLIMADGCSPANDGRGYVLRKIIRRAILFAQKLSSDDTLLVKLAQHFIETEHDIFPELAVSKGLILSIMEQEIQRFSHNLVSGQNILARYMKETKDRKSSELSGAHAFKLYDTYGFPLELTKVIAHESALTVDEEGFAKHMAAQQEQSKKKPSGNTGEALDFPEDLTTTFVGYTSTEVSSEILWEETQGATRWIITKESPFYVESGGQVNDDGVVTINHHSYHVIDLKKVGARFSPAIAVCLKPVETMGTCQVGDVALCQVDAQARIDTVRNHTATHMLHAALREALGEQARQAGSVVNKEYLRFDYNHHEALSDTTIKTIEDRVNEKIWENIETDIFTTTLAEAKERGVTAFFGEKYNPENVRVVAIPGFSTELCGGTHAHSTGIIGCFKIISDTALATGTRRMVAVTGPKALELYQTTYRDIKTLSEQFKAKLDDVVQAVNKQSETVTTLQRSLKQAHKQLVASQAQELRSNIVTTSNVPYLVALVDNADIDGLRTICTTLAQAEPGFYFAASNNSQTGKCQFFTCTSSAYLETVAHAHVAALLKELGLRGGGKPGTMQGGGTLLSQGALDQITEWIKNR